MIHDTTRRREIRIPLPYYHKVTSINLYGKTDLSVVATNVMRGIFFPIVNICNLGETCGKYQVESVW